MTSATEEKLYSADTIIDAYKNGLRKGKTIDPAILIDFLLRLKNAECWCAFGTGDPRYVKHNPLCLEIQKFMKGYQK